MKVILTKFDTHPNFFTLIDLDLRLVYAKDLKRIPNLQYFGIVFADRKHIELRYVETRKEVEFI